MPWRKFKRTLDPGRRVRVLIVDDSIAMRHLIVRALEADPWLEVIGTASNGRQALEQMLKLNPDIITLDIEMPEMNGLEALKNIRVAAPQVRVIMVSRWTERGAPVTIEALTSGADDYLKLEPAKPAEDPTACLREELCSKIKQFFVVTPLGESVPATPSLPNAAPAQGVLHRALLEQAPRVVAIGISTGGPSALAGVLNQFPNDFFLPILVVQHIPAQFTKLLCERLQAVAHLPVREAVDGEELKGGVILMAPGNQHMRVRLTAGERQPKVMLDQTPPENSCRPAVDPLFESLAQVYGGAVIAAVMTGMGHDGLRGAKLLKEAGSAVIVQDEATSAVWGMPRAVAEAGLANAVLPLPDIIPHILRECGRFPPPFNPGRGERCHA